MKRRRENKTGASMQVFGYNRKIPMIITLYSDYNETVRSLRKQLRARANCIRKDTVLRPLHCTICGVLTPAKSGCRVENHQSFRLCEKCKGVKASTVTRKFCRYCGEVFTREEADLTTSHIRRQKVLKQFLRYNQYRLLICKQGYTFQQFYTHVRQLGYTSDCHKSVYDFLKENPKSLRHLAGTSRISQEKLDGSWWVVMNCEKCRFTATPISNRPELAKQIEKDEECKRLKTEILLQRKKLMKSLSEL